MLQFFYFKIHEIRTKSSILFALILIRVVRVRVRVCVCVRACACVCVCVCAKHQISGRQILSSRQTRILSFVFY